MGESTKIRVAKKYWWFIRRLCRLVGFKGLSKRGGRNIDTIGGRIILGLHEPTSTYYRKSRITISCCKYSLYTVLVGVARPKVKVPHPVLPHCSEFFLCCLLYLINLSTKLLTGTNYRMH